MVDYACSLERSIRMRHFLFFPRTSLSFSLSLCFSLCHKNYRKLWVLVDRSTSKSPNNIQSILNRIYRNCILGRYCKIFDFMILLLAGTEGNV